MKSVKLFHVTIIAAALAATTLGLAVSAQAQTETILHNFNNAATGGFPIGGLLLDAAGNLYGTTAEGGSLSYCKPVGCGLAFRLSPSSGRWQESVLRDFPNSAQGSAAGLVEDAAGNFYGTTVSGGIVTGCLGFNLTGCGTVFELSPTPTGQWKRTLLHAFTGGADGAVPYASLVLDAVGNLYGTTGFGGSDFTGCPSIGCGVVFKLSPNSGGDWTESVLYSFTCGTDACERDPQAPVTFDAAGNLYGTTLYSTLGFGSVFELSPTTSGPWTETVLHRFSGADGINPLGGLIFDPAGNLYGTTIYGGNLADCSKSGCGTVFELSPIAGGWMESTIYAFTAGKDGHNPSSGLVRDAADNLYGTTQTGGIHNAGIVFELSPGSGGTWTKKILHSFAGSTTDGAYPNRGPLILDATGNLYGATEVGGTYNVGVVFKITP